MCPLQPTQTWQSAGVPDRNLEEDWEAWTGGIARTKE